MTKSTFIEPKPMTTHHSSPELVKLRGNPEVIVWRIGPGIDERTFEGVVVHCGKSTLSLHSLGYRTNRWVTEQFTWFDGSIMLENS